MQLALLYDGDVLARTPCASGGWLGSACTGAMLCWVWHVSSFLCDASDVLADETSGCRVGGSAPAAFQQARIHPLEAAPEPPSHDVPSHRLARVSCASPGRYNKGSSPKGRNVFLKNMEPFMNW